MDDIDYKYSRHRQTAIGQCKFNQSVDCDLVTVCNQCGWNPDVEKKRKKAIRNIKPEPKRKKWYIGLRDF